MEPVIIHAKATNLGHAQLLLTAARNSGLKISGITSIKNFTLELRSTERIESLIKNADLINEANKRLRKTKDKIKRLISALNNPSQL
jgi:tRNA(Phe) wybutosine-synthesizing methylase Tyw3